MPGFTTHYIMGMKAYNDMPGNQLKFIIAKYRWLYQLGLQGPDMFFYYIPILRHRDYRNVGSYMHEEHVNDFFSHALSAITKLPSRQQREQAISYIAGFMCHYIGDSICHPYIYGRINYNPAAPNNKTHGMHAQLENDIDAILLMKYKHKKPSEFNQAATICLNGFEQQFISDFLARVINSTYYPVTYSNNFQITPAMVSRSIVSMRFGCRALCDSTGNKKKHIGQVENLIMRSHIVSQKVVTDEVKDPAASLNLKHDTWCNPWDKRLASQQSFPQLFKRTMSKCHDVYYSFNLELSSGDAIKSQDFHELLSSLGNYSYHSGLQVK